MDSTIIVPFGKEMPIDDGQNIPLKSSKKTKSDTKELFCVINPETATLGFTHDKQCASRAKDVHEFMKNH